MSSDMQKNDIVIILIPIIIAIFIYYYKPTIIMQSVGKISEININRYLTVVIILTLVFWLLYYMANGCNCGKDSGKYFT